MQRANLIKCLSDHNIYCIAFLSYKQLVLGEPNVGAPDDSGLWGSDLGGGKLHFHVAVQF